MDDCLTQKYPRLKRVVDEHESMKQTIQELKPAIVKLTEAVERLHENHNQLVMSVDKHVSKATGAIWAMGASAAIVMALVTYIYISDQRSTEKFLGNLINEHKVMQSQIASGIERDAKSSAERELLFKALLQALDKKK